MYTRYPPLSVDNSRNIPVTRAFIRFLDILLVFLLKNESDTATTVTSLRFDYNKEVTSMRFL